MTKRKITRRRRAALDIEEAAFWYATEADEPTMERFVAAVETALAHVASHPMAGSLRFAEYGAHSDLRFWRLPKFPWLVFYLVGDDSIDVWRVLHAERDFPHWLVETE